MAEGMAEEADSGEAEAEGVTALQAAAAMALSVTAISAAATVGRAARRLVASLHARLRAASHTPPCAASTRSTAEPPVASSSALSESEKRQRKLEMIAEIQRLERTAEAGVRATDEQAGQRGGLPRRHRQETPTREERIRRFEVRRLMRRMMQSDPYDEDVSFRVSYRIVTNRP